MPVPVREKLRAVTKDLGSQARVARALGVSPSRVSRWLRQGEDPDPENRRKLEGLEFVLARLLQVYVPELAVDWLLARNPWLGERQAMDLIAEGRITEVLQAVDASESLGYA